MKTTLFVSTFLLLFSFEALAQNIDKEADTFPPDFGKGQTFLYVETVAGFKEVKDDLEKNFDKHYTGKYAMYDMREIPNETNRREGTRYYLFRTHSSGTADGRETGTAQYSFEIIDLQIGMEYKLSLNDVPQKQRMETCVKKLEKLRLINEKKQ